MTILSLSTLSTHSAHPLAHLIVARMRQNEMDIEALLQAMGYPSRSGKVLAKATERLRCVLSDDYLGLYAHQHCYDLKYTAEAFVAALVEAVGLSANEYGSMLWDLLALKPRDQYRFRMLANIQGDWLRQANPRFLAGMALNPFYHVALTPYFHLQDFTEQDRLAKSLAVQHYQSAMSRLPAHTYIQSYLLYYTKQGEDEVLYRCYEPSVDKDNNVVSVAGKFAGQTAL